MAATQSLGEKIHVDTAQNLEDGDGEDRESKAKQELIEPETFAR